MSRPAPSDLNYAPTTSKVYTSPGADVDLTAEFPEQQWPATELWISVPVAFASGNLVVRMQGAPTTDVTFPIPQLGVQAQGGGGCLIGPIRGAFSTLRSTTTAGISMWFFWSSGPA
jgi:hypothetical protein